MKFIILLTLLCNLHTIYCQHQTINNIVGTRSSNNKQSYIVAGKGSTVIVDQSTTINSNNTSCCFVTQIGHINDQSNSCVNVGLGLNPLAVMITPCIHFFKTHKRQLVYGGSLGALLVCLGWRWYV